VLCSWDWNKSHICLYRQSFMEWLNLEGICDKKLWLYFVPKIVKYGCVYIGLFSWTMKILVVSCHVAPHYATKVRINPKCVVARKYCYV
jgi:hypothetical protein